MGLYILDKTVANQKKWMQDNENGTCYAKTQYSEVETEYEGKDYVVQKKDGGSEEESSNSIEAIRDCNSVLRTGGFNPGFKALKADLNDDSWKTKGGLAKCADGESCPGLGTGGKGVELVGQFEVVILCLALMVSSFKYLQID